MLSSTFRNFRNQNLQGQSFKCQDLTNTDFSYSDIRGTDFTGANLTGANFSHAVAGLTPRWIGIMLILGVILAAIAGIAAAIAVYPSESFFPRVPGFDTILPEEQFFPKKSVPLIVALLMFFFIVSADFSFFIITLRQGIQKALGSVIIALTLSITLIAILSGISREDTPILNELIGLRISAFIDVIAGKTGEGSEIARMIVPLFVSVAGTVAMVIALPLAIAIAAIATNKFLTFLIFTETLLTATITSGIISYNGLKERLPQPLLPPDYPVLTAAIILPIVFVLISTHIARKLLAEDEKYAILRQIAIFILNLGGTSFRGADLTNTNFSYTTLKSTDFRFAKISRTLWYNSHQLDWAQVAETILIDPAVRDLLVSRNGYRKSYQEANLRGANLIDANLNYANLKNADLTNATLEAANLEWANLTQVQAINADFTNAKMTGSCGLGTWNIDSTTQLEWVDCRWVYLLEEPKPGTDDRERRPSSGEFIPGDFSKLFQEVVDTVDLIFRNGIDWKAFAQSFKKVQVENEDTELTIQSIENKGNGVVVVKVSVPSEANKGKIHSQFLQFYEEMIALATSQNQQLETYGQQMQWMTSVINEIVSKSVSEKLVVLRVINGSFEQGFSIIAQIWSDGHRLPREFNGQLPPSLKIAKCYHNWQAMYNAQTELIRIKHKEQITNFSKKDLTDFGKELKTSFNAWLDSELFLPIEKKLRQHLNSTDEIRVILQTEDIFMRHIPWHLWTFFKDYRKAELALSLPESDRVAKSITTKDKMRILTILGNSEGINVSEDRRTLENLPNAETVFLVEPTRQRFDELLWDNRGWDILCFSGHSHSDADGKNGYVYLNEKDKLSLEELENALKAAIELGLQLAIFNSCDGLGLATNLANLYIPQIIVMREPVPDLVAQEFLKSFLKAFSSGKSLYISVREAREKLQRLEEKFSYASWLPVICQNQAEIPLNWRRIAED